MSDAQLYLKPDVRVEPLVDRWHARAQLIAPATAAMNLFAAQARILRSYLQAPQIHAAASKNPAMAGGPFVDYATPRVEETRALLARLESREDLRALYEAIVELDQKLRTKASGFPLAWLYDKVPEALGGAVELVYDREHRASLRLIEPLLYRSGAYDRARQSLMLAAAPSPRSPNFLATPRLDAPGQLHLPIPFDHPGIDDLFAMSLAPRGFADIAARLGVEDPQAPLLRELLSPQAPAAAVRHEGPGASWRHLGRGGILVESGTGSLLLDPVLDAGPEVEALPARIDEVLITRDRPRDLLIETLLRLRHRTARVVVPRSGGGALQDPSLRLLLQSIGFTSVVELGELEDLATPLGRIIGLPFLGGHGDLDVRAKLSYRIETGGHSLVFAAGAGNLAPALYGRLRAALGGVDLLFLALSTDGPPLSWDYGPLFTSPLPRDKDQARRISGTGLAGAKAVVEQLAPKALRVHAEGDATELVAFARNAGVAAAPLGPRAEGKLG